MATTLRALALTSAIVVATGAAAGAPGCSHPQPPPPATPASPPAVATPPPPTACKGVEPLRVFISATPRLNPGEKGEALATVIRLYQLKGINKLIGIGFDDLLDHDKDTLGEDFVGVQEVTINPGERIEPPITRKPDANYLLAVALFRQPAGTTWKTTKKLSQPNPQFCEAADASDSNIRLALDENRIELR